MHGVKWTKTERYGAKLDATAQLVYPTVSNKNNVSPKEAVQDVQGIKWTKTERHGANLDATEQLFDSTVSNKNKGLEDVHEPKWTKNGTLWSKTVCYAEIV